MLDASASYTDADVDTHLNTASATDGQILAILLVIMTG